MGLDKELEHVDSFSVMEEAGTSFQITGIAPTSVEISYTTLDGNQPGYYGNYLAIWQSGGTIPWSKTPIHTQALSGNEQSAGTVSFEGLELTDESYIVGYSVVPIRANINNFCASGMIQKKMQATGDSIQALTMQLESVSSNTARISYEALAGYNPAKNGSWIGIWKGNPELYTVSPKYAAKVEAEEDSGLVVFNDVKMLRNSTYTVGFFMNGWNKDIPNLSQGGLAYRITFRT